MKNTWSPVLSGCKVFVSLAAILGVGTVWAQSYDNPGLGQQPVIAHPQDYKPLGTRAGSFMLHPGVELAAEYTDNVFYSNQNEEGDFIWHIRPYITAQSTWSKHSFNVRLAADIGRHSDYGFRDYEDYFLNIGGRLDVKTRTSINYTADFMQLHEGLNIRSAEQGVEPTVYTLMGGDIGLDHVFNRLSMGIGIGQRYLDYDNTKRIDGTVIDNQDRDRSDTNMYLRLGYQFKTDKQFYARLDYYDSDYDQTFDRHGLMRSNNGYALSAGIKFSITSKLYGDLGVNYNDREYDDPVLRDVSGWGLGAGLTWYATRLTTVRANVVTDVQATTSQYASGYLGTLYAIRADHELTRDIQLNAFLSYRDNDYTLIDGAPADARSHDKVSRAGIGASYFINRSMRLSASYDYAKLKSNVPGDGFDVNRFWLVLGFEK